MTLIPYHGLPARAKCGRESGNAILENQKPIARAGGPWYGERYLCESSAMSRWR
jgi:hypothetical protein